MSTQDKELSRRHKDWVMLRMYVFDAERPKSVDVRKSSLDYEGCVHSKKQLTGVYGTNSGDVGGFMATEFAQRQGKSVYFLDVQAEIPNFHSTRAQMTREIIKDSRWLHIDRVSVSLRDEIKEGALKWIKRKFGDLAHREMIDASLSQLMLRYPEFATKLLDEDEDLGMLVHPVYTKFDIGAERRTSLWVATIRYDRIEIKNAVLRHLASVPCVY